MVRCPSFNGLVFQPHSNLSLVLDEVQRQVVERLECLPSWISDADHRPLFGRPLEARPKSGQHDDWDGSAAKSNRFSRDFHVSPRSLLASRDRAEAELPGSGSSVSRIGLRSAPLPI